MDETTRTSAPARTGTDDVDHVADQPALPLGLTFDDGTDEPIGYSLTARARRQVAPDTLPTLRVVDAAPPSPDERDGDLERPGDTRPSRARALRRAGVALTAIAEQLDVDDLVVRAWVGDVPVARSGRRGTRRGVDPERPTVASADGVAAPTPPGREPGSAPRTGRGRPAPASATMETEQRRTGFALARAAAAEEARGRLDDAVFAAGLGLLGGIVSVDDHSATITTSRIEVAAAVMRWLRTATGLDVAHIRVVLRLGPDVAGDLARHRWATVLGLPKDRVLHTRWREAPAPDAVEVLVRLPDPAVAATLAGWCDALLAGPADDDQEGAGF